MQLYSEEQFYAGLWEKDRLAKCAREEMDGVLQIERNKEMIKVSQKVYIIITG